MPQPRHKLSQMNIMNNMQFVFAICHGVLAEPEHINCTNNEHSHYLITSTQKIKFMRTTQSKFVNNFSSVNRNCCGMYMNQRE